MSAASRTLTPTPNDGDPLDVVWLSPEALRIEPTDLPGKRDGEPLNPFRYPELERQTRHPLTHRLGERAPGRA